MSYHFSAYQFDDAYQPTKLHNWEVPKWYPERPCVNVGRTQIISNDRGNLLPGIPRTNRSPWGEYKNGWHYPKKITRKVAQELSATPEYKFETWKKHCERNEEKYRLWQLAKQSAKNKNKEEVICSEDKEESDVKTQQNEIQQVHQASSSKDEEKSAEQGNVELTSTAVVPYVPGDFTEEKHRSDSHQELDKYRFKPDERYDDVACLKGFPNTREDFSRQEEKPEVDLKTQSEEFYAKHEEMMSEEYVPPEERCSCKKKKILGKMDLSKRLSTPIVAAINNFDMARRLHKENLEHKPLPDTVTDALYRKFQMERNREPGMALKDGNYATGVAWKAFAGFGPTRCTKLKVFRPKTSITDKVKDSVDDRPSSVSSFDRKWRFIRKQKVTPMQLAVCWDLTPLNPNDEPKRTTHIDGSNGSQAPAVFSMVHSPKPDFETDLEKEDRHQESFQEIQNHGKIEQRPKTTASSTVSSSKTSKHSNKFSDKAKRVQSAHAEISKNTCSHCSCSYETKNTKDSHSRERQRLCVACELKNVKIDDERTGRRRQPKSEFKQAFKAGVPQKKVSTSASIGRLCIGVSLLRIPKMKDPYRIRSYSINSLAPPFSLQNYKRQDYPEHWRLASVYQHSYKPLYARKRPLIQTIFK